MTVTIVKKDVKTQSGAVHASADLKTQIIESLCGKVDPLFEKKAAVDEVKKILAKANKAYTDAVNDFMGDVPLLEIPPAEKMEIDGEKHIATIGAESNVRTVKDNKRVFEILNSVQEDLAFELMSFGLGQLDKYMTPEQLEEVLEQSWSGKRGVSVK